MSAPSFFWHDYETFGRSARTERPAQFAGVRTDLDLNEIEPPLVLHCQPAPDYLPDPESVLITRLLPQTCLRLGVPEDTFARRIEHAFATPGTVGVGYNSIRFDDEFTRFLFWRNLIDPYAREWQNDCGRWDLLDVVRCAFALRPDGITWPTGDDGRPSFRLEKLTAANGLTHDSAHEALSDVRATLALARLQRQRQPRLWDFCLRLRRKQAVIDEVGVGRPFLHVSGQYPVERGCLAVVWPLAPHPTNRNELIVWDLAEDPSVLMTLTAAEVRARLFVRSADLPEGQTRLPIKTIHLNKSPVVIANLKTLSPAMAERWGVDDTTLTRHLALAQQHTGALAGLWPEVFQRDAGDTPADVDADLYGAFLRDPDRRRLQQLREVKPETLRDKAHGFDDPRLDELVFRWRARSFPATLSADEAARWQAHCGARLHHGEGGARTLSQLQDTVDRLGEDADDDAQALLGDLLDYAEAIAPPA